MTPPLSEEVVRSFQLGDVVYVDGTIYGVRDRTLIRMFDEKVPPPVPLAGAVVLHTAPNVRVVSVSGGGPRYEPVSIGTTTSTRMNRFTEPLLRQYGVRAIVGKAGLLDDSVEAMRRYGACYLTYVGGAAALETTQIEEIEEVWWEDLMPECLWKFRVKDFGPLTVTIDAHGGNLYKEVKEAALRHIRA